VSAAPGPEDKELLKHGVERGESLVAAAIFALLHARVGELVEGLIRAETPEETRRLQGAITELRRWAAYPEELARRVELMEAEEG
jgi:hypothetical protein